MNSAEIEEAQPFAQAQGRSDVRRFIAYVDRACVEFGALSASEIENTPFATKYELWLRYISSYNRAQNSKRRETVQKSTGHYSEADIHRLWITQNGLCAYCNTPLADEWHVDHVVPLSRGGSNGPENIALACQSCNLSKGAKLVEEWKAP